MLLRIGSGSSVRSVHQGVLVMDINIIGQIAYFTVCFGVLVILFTPVNVWLLDKMFLLLDKVFMTPKN